MSTRVTSTTSPLVSGTGRMADAKRRVATAEKSLRDYAPPHRAQFNYIPSPDVLKSMIDRALEALSKGVYWDRGSIINIVL